MSFFLGVAIAVLVLAAVVTVLRIVRPSSLGDRAVAFDLLTAVIACGLLVWAAGADDGLPLDLAVLVGLLGFLASVTVARFIESREGEDE
jgi:multicomponent Na+:H+ antiporter subunit F